MTRRDGCTKRRLFLRLALCVLFGALATLATAWGPQIPYAWRGWLDESNPGIGPQYYDYAGTVLLVDADGGTVGAFTRSRWCDYYMLMSSPDEGFSEGGLKLPVARAPLWVAHPPRRPPQGVAAPESIQVSTLGYGHPWRALRAVEVVNNYARSRTTDARCVWAFRPAGLGDLRLPLGPIWLGLLGDITFWGSIPAVPLYGLPALRRWRRRRRGLCVSCGYPRDAARSGPCPECGHSPK